MISEKCHASNIDGVKGYYPAFDVTDPEFVTGIVTDKGIYKPKLECFLQSNTTCTNYFNSIYFSNDLSTTFI